MRVTDKVLARALHWLGSMMCTRLFTHAALAALVLAPASAFAQAPAAKDRPPLWDMQVGASFVGTSGNSDTSSAGADFAAHRRGDVWQLEGAATGVRTTADGTTSAERYLGHVRGQRDLTTRLGVTSGVELERDQFAGIAFRSTIDGGVSWRLVRSTAWTLGAVTALSWDHEDPTGAPDVNDPGAVLQLLSRIPFGSAGDTTQRVTLYPDLKDSRLTRSEAEITAQAAMSSHLALKIGYLLRHSDTPMDGFKKTDSTTTASVVLRWKASTPAPR